MVRHKETSDLNPWLDVCTWWILWFTHNLRRIRKLNPNPLVYNISEQFHLPDRLFDFEAFNQAWSCLDHQGFPRISLIRYSCDCIPHFILGSGSILKQPFNSWLHVSCCIYSSSSFNYGVIWSTSPIIGIHLSVAYTFTILSWRRNPFPN